MSQTSIQPHTTSTSNTHYLAPSVDIYENEDAFLMQADLPGIERENLQIQYHEGILSFSALASFQTEEEEASRGFRRKLHFPGQIDAENISAALDQGVLTLTLPKAPESKPRPIPIQSA